MGFPVAVFCINLRSCFFFKELHHMNCNSYKAGVSAEVPLAVMTQGGIALLISVHADEVLLLPGAHGGALWLHTQPI